MCASRSAGELKFTAVACTPRARNSSAIPRSSSISIVRAWMANARDSVAPCSLRSISRQVSPWRASSPAIRSPVGPAPTTSASMGGEATGARAVAEIVGNPSLRPGPRSATMPRMPSPRPVVIVAVEGVMTLDVTGPLEVFDAASRYLTGAGSSDPGYSVTVATPQGAPVRSSSGLRLAGDQAIEDVGAVDTLIVAGGEGARASRQPEVVAWLRDRPRPRRLASVCTGAYLLAAAGLLDGRRATTHWGWCEHLAARHPEVDVLADPIY